MSSFNSIQIENFACLQTLSIQDDTLKDPRFILHKIIKVLFQNLKTTKRYSSKMESIFLFFVVLIAVQIK